MYITFHCEKCRQQLEVDASGAGSQIECPTCGAHVVIPNPDPSNVHIHNPIAHSAGAREEKHFKVPVGEGPSKSLIEKPNKPLEMAAKDDERRVRIRTIRHADCMEVGKDKFDDVVSQFLNQVGEEHIISIDHITYTNRDLSSGELMSDYGVLVVYRG